MLCFFQSETGESSSFMDSAINWRSGMEPWNDTKQQLNINMDVELFGEGKSFPFSVSQLT